MTKISGVKGATVKQKARKKEVIIRLTKQLLLGTKVPKQGGDVIPLETKDITRINKELEILKSRV
jgi:hypothetical protein